MSEIYLTVILTSNILTNKTQSFYSFYIYFWPGLGYIIKYICALYVCNANVGLPYNAHKFCVGVKRLCTISVVCHFKEAKKISTSQTRYHLYIPLSNTTIKYYCTQINETFHCQIEFANWICKYEKGIKCV